MTSRRRSPLAPELPTLALTTQTEPDRSAANAFSTGAKAVQGPHQEAPKSTKSGNASDGTWGIGSVAHLAFAMLQQKAGIELHHVPYQGGAPTYAAILGGHVDRSPCPLPRWRSPS